MSNYVLAFNRGNGKEIASFETVDEAVAEADALLEYGHGWWFEISQDDKVVMDHKAVIKAMAIANVGKEEGGTL